MLAARGATGHGRLEGKLGGVGGAGRTACQHEQGDKENDERAHPKIRSKRSIIDFLPHQKINNWTSLNLALNIQKILFAEDSQNFKI